jgi:acyl-CoA dehydrogenase
MTMTSDTVLAVGQAADEILRTDHLESTQGEGWAGARWATLAESGLTSVGVAEANGGSGGGPLEAAAVIRATGRQAASGPIVENTLLAGWVAAETGLTLPAGPGSVTDPLLPGGRGRVAWGRHVDWVLALAEDGRSVRLLSASDVTWQPGENLAGEPRDGADFATSNSGSVAELPVDARWRLSLLSALGRSIQIAGAADSVLDLTGRYVGERVQFGKPLARQQAVQQLLARLAGEVCLAEVTSQAALEVLAAHDLGHGQAELAIAAAKVNTSRAARAIARLSHQLHGAIGLTEEYSLGAFTLRLWSWAAEGGDERYWSSWLGRRASELGPAGVWSAITRTSDERISVGG